MAHILLLLSRRMEYLDSPTELTRQVLKCQKSKTHRKELIDAIALLIYTYPKNRYNWDEDDCSDFFCRFYPKINILIERFRYTGKPFEAYLYVSLKWQLKSFAADKHKRERETLFLASKPEWCFDEEQELCVRENAEFISSQARNVLELNSSLCIENNAVKRRMMYLTLKAAQGVSSHIVERVSLITGYRKEWIYVCLDRLRKRMEVRLERVDTLRKRRNKVYLKIYRIHEELSDECEPQYKNRLIEKLVYEKKRMLAVIDDLARVPTSPTHKDIAEVLGVPKGSVDSGLYYIKNAFQHVDFAEDSLQESA